MSRYPEWFSFDVVKRAAGVRANPLPLILKELLANSLDARAKNVDLAIKPAEGTRRDRSGLRAFEVLCNDDGSGCDDPEILRRFGSTTHDLHPQTRGRFGQGLIDVLAVAETAEIRTLLYALIFDTSGCTISRRRETLKGMRVEALLRHDGGGYEDLEGYFRGVILPDGVSFSFNGSPIDTRAPARVVDGLELKTVLYDPQTGKVTRPARRTQVHLFPQYGPKPMIHELGLPVDEIRWELPLDVNVLQKTPLTSERQLLPDWYKEALLKELLPRVSDLYEEHMNRTGTVPSEVRDDAEMVRHLTQAAQDRAIKTQLGTDKENIARENPLDPDNPSEAEEVRTFLKMTTVNRGHLPAGIRELIKDTPSVAQVHDERCKPQISIGTDFPAETPRQRVCLEIYREIASVLVGRPIVCDRIQGGVHRAVWADGIIKFNIDVANLWDDPLGEESLGVVIHECEHSQVSGHSQDFARGAGRFGGRLAAWIGEHPEWWQALREKLEGAHTGNAS